MAFARPDRSRSNGGSRVDDPLAEQTGVWTVLLVAWTDRAEAATAVDQQMSLVAAAMGPHKTRLKSWVHIDDILHPLEEVFLSGRADGSCVICLDHPALITLLPCGHTCVCPQCILLFGSACPVCRQHYTSMLHQRL